MKIKNFDFFNLFYSFGAAIVLLGALFKVIDTTYADYIFITGLVVEILVFLVSAFLFSSKEKELSWEKVFPELVSDETTVSGAAATQSAVSLGNNMSEVSQNLGEIATTFKQMKQTISNLDNSVSQLDNAHSGYKEEMQQLKKNLTDINNYYSDFINALNSKIKRD